MSEKNTEAVKTKKKISAKDIIIPTVTLFIICLISTLLLAVVDNTTKGKIAQMQQASDAAARSKVLASAASFTQKDDYYIGKDKSGKTVGYVFTESAKSYGGNVVVMTGIDTEGKVTAVEITSINDTPGLGMNAKNSWFKKQFEGKSGTIGVNKSSASKTEIKALTGATITSKGVTSAVNAALAEYNEKIGGAV
jgi:electron transport complex protein RnfG